jgi:redox-sensitive bicupin YhaK (pirin superfamily)
MKITGKPWDTVIVPRTRDLGEGFEVRRALPSSQRRLVGPFVFFDQMGPAVFSAGQGLDVRPHPHIGLATVTICLKARSCIATAWERCSRSAPALSTG